MRFQGSRNELQVLSSRKSSLGFNLLIVLLLFNSFRPDRLIPGGAILTYVPTLLLGILGVLWLTAPKKTLSNPQTKYFALFLVILGIGAFGARNAYWAFKTTQSLFLYVFIPYLMVVQFVDTSDKVERYIRLYVFGSIFFIVLGLFGKGVVRISALEDENEFALFTNSVLPLAYFLVEVTTTNWKKYFYYAVVVLCILGTMITFSRGGLVGLCAVGLYIFVKGKHKVAALAIAGMFVLIVAAISTGDAVRHGGEHRGNLEYYLDDMMTMFAEGSSEGTGKERLESWKAGWSMFLDHPLVGVGPSNFGMWFQDYYQAYGSIQPENMWGRVAHSLYFTLIPETGLAGILVFGMMVWSNYRSHRQIVGLERRIGSLTDTTNLAPDEKAKIRVEVRMLRCLSFGYCGALIAFLVTGAFITVLWYSYFWALASWWAVSTNAARRIETLLDLRPIGQRRIEGGQHPNL